MGVYVDRLPLESVLGKWAGGAHMYGSSLEELNSMADKIGVLRERFEIIKEVTQYRLTSEERSLAIERGATEIMLGDIPSDALRIPLRARIAELANAIEQISRALARVATETEDPLRGRASLLFDNVDTLKIWCMMEDENQENVKKMTSLDPEVRARLDSLSYESTKYPYPGGDTA